MQPPAPEELRPLHLPDPVSWWPIAPGWWILFFLVCALIAALWVFFYRYKRRPIIWQQTAQDELNQLRTQYLGKKVDATNTLLQCSVLMRRCAIAVEGREKVAALTDEDWLLILDKLGNTTQFSQGIGQLLISFPYQKASDLPAKDVQAVLDLCANLIDQPRQSV